jgi:hypothetical protein
MGLKDKIKDFTSGKHKIAFDITMTWVTIYITGKGDFREDVGKKLEDSDLNLMPGYTGGSAGDTDLNTEMYWIDDKVEVREIKEAIGSKLIWKHRLRFYNSLESFIESQNTKKNTSEFTAEERALLEEIHASVYREAS